MPVSGVASHRAQAGRGYDLVAAKVRRPQVRPGMVCRSSMLERLARGDACPIVSVVAPPGYGKTTLLSQWAEHDGQAFAWVSVEEGTATRRCCSVTSPKRLMWSSRSISGCSTRSPPREFDTWLGCSPAGVGVFVDDFASGAGPG